MPRLPSGPTLRRLAIGLALACTVAAVFIRLVAVPALSLGAADLRLTERQMRGRDLGRDHDPLGARLAALFSQDLPPGDRTAVRLRSILVTQLSYRVGEAAGPIAALGLLALIVLPASRRSPDSDSAPPGESTAPTASTISAGVA